MNVNKEKLHVISGLLRDLETPVFPYPVEPSHIRYVVSIMLVGDGAASRTVDIYKIYPEEEVFEKKIPMVPIAPADMKMIPDKIDLENPVMVLEGGSNLAGVVNAGTGISIAVWYYDDIR